MAITDYASLKTELAAFAHRTDLTSEMDTFIGLAEAEFNRVLRTRNMDTTTTLSATTNSVALPADFLQLRNLEIATSPIKPLRFVTPEQRDLYDLQASTGAPRLYSIVGSNLILAPTPDQTYSLNCEYYAKIPGLSGGNTTNWLCTNYPQAYFYGCMYQIALYLVKDDRAAQFNQLAQGILSDINRTDDRAQYSGSTLRIRPDAGY